MLCQLQAAQGMWGGCECQRPTSRSAPKCQLQALQLLELFPECGWCQGHLHSRQGLGGEERAGGALAGKGHPQLMYFLLLSIYLLLLSMEFLNANTNWVDSMILGRSKEAFWWFTHVAECVCALLCVLCTQIYHRIPE